ncbi:MAG: hypothetical protein K6T83_08535 [Alicyclobacillus sp.]|nr:hypothetical protein [Alicyclobacillus sp.]
MSTPCGHSFCERCFTQSTGQAVRGV